MVNQKKAKTLSLRLFIAVILFIATLYLFYFIADEIVIENQNSFDKFIFLKLSSITSASITRLMLWITFLGSTTFLFPAYGIIILYFLFIVKKHRTALDIAMVGLIGTALLFILKDIFRRQRPLDPLIHKAKGFSFPSGHSFSSFTFFGLLIYITWETNLKKVWKVIISVALFLLATSVATSRVYLHVHYASDVLGGFCLSIMWLLLSIRVLHTIDKNF